MGACEILPQNKSGHGSAPSSTPVMDSVDNTLSAAELQQGWTLLFNGKDMDQWRNFKQEGLSDKWQIEDNAMTLSGTGGGDILTKKTYQDFDLKLDWKISVAGNSGVFIMTDELGGQIYSHAVEIQILDNERHSDNKLASHLSGSVYDMIASPVSSHKQAGEWNQMRIRMHNKALKVWQNDALVADIIVGSQRWDELLALSKFSDWPGFGLTERGHIGLQDHGNQVAFKNIKILELGQ
ncbi:MAG: glycosyl hydrolase [Robiginitomaculum sp.]|nr:MAG: glycosyl hydrolase [Robiginitomaculum sp.]